MRIPFRRRHAARRRSSSSSPSPLSFLLTVSSLASLPTTTRAINFTPAPPSNIDLSSLGSVGIAGDFTGISLYQFEEQNEEPFRTNGSEALLARLPNGAFATVVDTDASIMSMCSFVMRNGTNAGVVLGGNFTSLGSLESTAIALFNPNTSQITPLSGLSGQVNAVLCDQEHNSVFVGGNFKGGNSTNAIAWVGTDGWTALPFAGFNGPVTSITKASNGHIIFGGSFTGLGNASTPTQPDGQVINLSTANITSGSSTTTTGFSDPKNIVCKTDGVDGAGSTWLLEDNTPGFWQASFDFGFQPTKLRLWNTHQDGRGTQTWRYTALPLNGIMNFTYIDPATGQNASCTSECPLSSDKNVAFQDFHFVNAIGMNSFRIDISAWYGSGGGLDGIELFENDIFVYAINRFNEPSCSGSATISNVTTTGPFTESPSLQSQSNYLTAQLSSPITSSSASVVFIPDIRQAGNYSVNMYTPGCIQDGSCSARGQVNITMSMVSGQQPTSVQLFQTNNYDKYDQIYFGAIDLSSSSFRPTVTMTPLNGQSLSNMTFVAQRVGFTLLNSTGGLQGLFEYDPTVTSVNTSSFSLSAFDKLGSTFSSGSAVTALATLGDVTYIGGNFSSTAANNIVSVNSNNSSAQGLDGGLNGAVYSMFVDGSSLFVGGRFTATQDRKVANMNNVAVYDTTKNSWSPLGAGVDGPVVNVVGMTMNVTNSSSPEVVIALTGSFGQLSAFGDNPAVPVDGFGVWVPSQGNWLQNLDLPVESVDGRLLTSLLDVPGADALYGGSLSSAQISAGGAATLTSSGVTPLGIKIQAPANSTSAAPATARRDTTQPQSGLAGVVTGAFDTGNGRNKTILGGHFTATASNGSAIQNIAIIDNKNNGTVTGLGPEISASSTFLSMAINADTLFAVGNVSGTINGNNFYGLVSYNLAADSFTTQPPSLTDGSSVTSVKVRPNTGDVYVGGSFTTAGSLPCPAVCFFSTSAGQWNRVGTNLAGTVDTMMWTGDSTLLAGGTLTVNDSAQTFLATYDASKQTWNSFPGADLLPGPVEILTVGSSDGSQVWVAGTAANGTIYLMKYDGKNWNAVGQTLSPGTDIRSLQIFSLTANHDATPLLDAGQVLMLTGSIGIPGFGAASAAYYNGTAFEPFALTTNANDTAGTISSIFVEKANFFTSNQGHHLPLVGIVLIGLAISLGLMLIIVAAGLALDRIRKKREGYVPAPTSMYDRGSGIQRIPPQALLEGLGKPQAGAPQV